MRPYLGPSADSRFYLQWIFEKDVYHKAYDWKNPTEREIEYVWNYRVDPGCLGRNCLGRREIEEERVGRGRCADLIDGSIDGDLEELIYLTDKSKPSCFKGNGDAGNYGSETRGPWTSSATLEGEKFGRQELMGFQRGK